MNDTQCTALEVIGINAKHIDLKNEFVRRLISLLQENELSLKSYGIAEDYCGNAEETVRLETSAISISLQLRAKK